MDERTMQLGHQLDLLAETILQASDELALNASTSTVLPQIADSLQVRAEWFQVLSRKS